MDAQKYKMIEMMNLQSELEIIIRKTLLKREGVDIVYEMLAAALLYFCCRTKEPRAKFSTLVEGLMELEESDQIERVKELINHVKENTED